METESRQSFVRSILAKVSLGVAAAIPVATFVSGGASLSEQNLEPGSCIVRHEFELLGIVAAKFDSYDRECGEAQAVLAIMNAGTGDPRDIGMIAVAIEAWSRKHPRIAELVEDIRGQITAGEVPRPLTPVKPEQMDR
ncbi:hypothetical protein PA01_12765 [Azoarcus sp. PA01]|nr:hypothetical protein PA01_12765 [Azoarcus sp. PA01]